MPINDETKRAVRERANYLYEYCHSSERLSASRFTLALACRRCNERRYNFVASIDPESQETVSIFNPRLQEWDKHFAWTDNGTLIEGITPIGRATCIRLDLNDTRYPEEESIRETRRFWIKTGLHPP
ncbi:MAG: HNH endonuclease [Leptolyngbyaceae cyanobacterium]